jgi:protein involved in ribonucleotide reduction
MLIVYVSLTGNIERFLNEVDYKNKLKLTSGDEIIDSKFILITYSINYGDIPIIISKFLKNNHKNCLGVIGSGNKNWGNLYCGAINKINQIYNIPILLKFELSGNMEDRVKFMEIMDGI